MEKSGYWRKVVTRGKWLKRAVVTGEEWLCRGVVNAEQWSWRAVVIESSGYGEQSNFAVSIGSPDC